MTKVYELANGHKMVADIDESTRVCNITETTLDSIVSKLNYYAEQTDALDKIRAEIEEKYGDYDICEWFEDYDYEENDISEYQSVGGVSDILAIIDKYKAESEEVEE